MPNATDRKLLYICGSGHSGSTLLDMLLGGHSRVASLGEVARLYFSVRCNTEGDRCTCGQDVLECPFWKAVEVEARRVFPDSTEPALANLVVADKRAEILRTARGFRARQPHETSPGRSRLNELALVIGSRSLWRLLGSVSSEVALHRRIARDLTLLYELVRRAHDTPIIVDSTKTPGYLKRVYLERNAPIHFINVLRDGRAVCYSRIRREGVSMEVAARLWREEHFKRRAAQFTIRDARFHAVRYEDLCRDPESRLRDLCHACGFEFEPMMLDFRAERHNLGGNPMRFRDNESKIKLDERWKAERTEEGLRVFERIAGRLNRQLGYPPSEEL